MKVKINGEFREFEKALTIVKLLSDLEINQKNCLVELNQNPLTPEEYGQLLEEGDELELVRFIGGG